MTDSVACACGTCSTCSGAAPRAPVGDPLIFRHGAIKRRLLDRIAAVEIDARRPLERLGVRDDNDPAIALIDALCGSLHVLAWNANRLFEDGTIRQTEDREAMIDLTRLLGYELRPALAATTTLAFTLAEHAGSPERAILPKGSKFASVPGPDEKPQIFETDAPLEARAAWNALAPVVPKHHQPVTAQTRSIEIAGASTPAKPGDLALVHLNPQETPPKWLLARIAGIRREPNPGGRPPYTHLDLSAPALVDAPSGMSGKAFQDRVLILGQKATSFGATAPDLALMSEDIRNSQRSDVPEGAIVPIIRLGDGLPTEWRDLVMSPGGTAAGGEVDLDAVYGEAAAGRVVLFSTLNGTPPTQMGLIEAVSEGSRKDFGLSAKISRIKVTGIDLSSGGFSHHVRETAIAIESAQEMLLVEDQDVTIPEMATNRLRVRGRHDIPPGRRIVLSGEEWTNGPPGSGPVMGEVVIVQSVSPAGDDTELAFEAPINRRFRSRTLKLLANAVAASHGETPANGAELLGSSNAAAASPRFRLKDAPLAYVPAPNPRGYAPAIEVRVGERLYMEAPTLFGLSSEDRAFTIWQVRGNRSEVQFAGRLPTGANNVTALYRKGGGMAGNLPAARITTALEPVVGVATVTNPVPAEGASDAETIEEMRALAPQSIRTLDRVVSLADVEAFASRYRGVGKALATELRRGMRIIVCVTIATTEMKPPAAGSDIGGGLAAALKGVMPPGRVVRIDGFTDLTARLRIALALDPAFRRVDVEAAVRAALGAAFGRAARRFAEALHESQVLAVVQGVEGVRAAGLLDFSLPSGPADREGRLLSPAPAFVDDVLTHAGLLSIDPAQIEFAEMKP
jgi:hypothetical protein